MRVFDALRSVALALACLGLALPGNCRAAVSAEPQSAIADVSLEVGGRLHGQVLDANGVPTADSLVKVSFQNQPVAETRTNSNGEFQVTGLRGGVHAVASERGVALCRFWAPDTAPPEAPSRILLVDGDTLVRGKSCGQHRLAHALSNPWLLIGVAAVAIAVPVALNGDDGDSGS